MRTLGLLGGMSWESTALYYRRINELVRERLGGLHSAPLVLWSVDFAGIEALQAAGDWDAAGRQLADCGRRVAAAGAEALVLCTNTMHVVADRVAAGSGLPLIHIADATAGAVRAAGCTRPLLLATRYTMEQDFYLGRLRREHGLDVRVPGEEDRETVHRAIFDELCVGVASPAAKAAYLDIVARAEREQGVDSVILGCTEVGLLIGADDLALPVFDSAELHVRAAVDFLIRDHQPAK
ncbi:aspartate racemase [Limimonas halophila]|uniref:Aspartate racemase n=1 Tax=Limimonas halophila TaxID=1082479 RepID=A0A1G7UY02_9PROT|nr:aspartate/glutamate racemase family protein [Limimonas halophila]SDG52376.1 aspartate racemase [Limimonas halophila]